MTNYISKIQVGGQTYWVKDSEVRSSLKNYLPLSGGDLSGNITLIDSSTGATNIIISNDGNITAQNLKLEDVQEITTPISNVLTLDENDEIKYHPTENLLAELGGIGNVSVNSSNTVVYTVGTITT